MLQPKILVVDDEWSMRELLKNTLVLSGFQVTLASSAEEFRDYVRKERPDAILLDIMLGEKDGTEVYKELVQQGFDPKIPVVFVTALAVDCKPTFPRADHRYALVGKPFDPGLLVEKLRQALRLREETASAS